MNAIDDRGDDALALLAPHLGELIGPPERVDGLNARHPGQTFDFAAERTDGWRLAIEVTRAWDRGWLEDQAPFDQFAERVRLAVEERAPTLTGHFAVTLHHGSRQQLKSLVGLTADRIIEIGQARSSDRKITRNLSVARIATNPRLIVSPMRSAAEFELGTEAHDRFLTAVADCSPKLEAAGAAGYETHLAVIHWVFGSTDAWRHALTRASLSQHPQYIWAVDLGGQPGREAIVRLRPSNP